MITIALNGFGRIGRNFIRTLVHDPNALHHITIAAINIGPAQKETVAHMFKYDTIMGTFNGTVVMDGDNLIINNIIRIKIIAEIDPEKINWGEYNIEWVVDATGRFTERDQAQRHIQSGAKYVLITAPTHQDDITIIPGVNERDFNPIKNHIISLASCTTNAFIPILKIVQDTCGITQGFMTTLHAYTNSQVLLDVEKKDVRRGRAAALNIIPTTTGASKMVSKIIPSLDGKINAIAVRVPVGIVSLIDFTFISERSFSAETINEAFKNAANYTMKNIIHYSTEPLVSSDYIGSPFSVTIDSLLTGAQASMGKIFGWYDNEWGYSTRLKDFLLYVASLQSL